MLKNDKYLNLLKTKQIEIDALQKEINLFKEKKSILQKKFNFIIPDYIVDEIIESDKNNLYINLNLLINCAIMNGQISNENGDLLKKAYLI